jgi:protease I
MFRSLARLALAFATFVLVIPDTSAHDSWISRGGHRNAAGEWCCGEGDCFVIPKERIMMTGEGYVIIHGPLAGVGPQQYESVAVQRGAALARWGILALQTPRRNAPLLLRPAPGHLRRRLLVACCRLMQLARGERERHAQFRGNTVLAPLVTPIVGSTTEAKMKKMSGKRVAILATHGFEQAELEVPLKKLKDAGATVEVVSPEKGEIKGWDSKDWGHPVKVDRNLADVSADDYDAIVLPGGQINPDLLRVNAKALAFIRAFFDQKKVVAAVCHAPWLLIETGIIKGRKATSYRSIKTDVINAGGQVGRFPGRDRSRGDHLAPAQRPSTPFPPRSSKKSPKAVTAIEAPPSGTVSPAPARGPAGLAAWRGDWLAPPARVTTCRCRH